MEYRIQGWEPAALFHFFEDISAIPRGSGNEKAVSDFILAFARERGLEAWQDGSYNVVIRKAGSPGAENCPPVILQGHLDMVCEKRSGAEHDFLTQGLDLVVEDGVLRANGTTLGADDGVAVAMMLAVLDDPELVHPPLECVFTTGEETGLLGAHALDMSRLRGRTLINLDTEEDGLATVSSAGGMRFTLSRPAAWEQASGTALYLSVSGLQGGHSGGDIDRERGNAIKLMARLLHRLLREPEARLADFSGGGKDNAIPRECAAAVLYPNEALARQAQETVRALAGDMAEAIRPAEPDFACVTFLEPAEAVPVLSREDARAMADAAFLAPNGVRQRNPKKDNFVVTSLNLGIVSATPEACSLVFLPRSSVETLQEETAELLTLLAETFGFSTEITGRYPGWAYTEHSPIRELFQAVYREQTGKELEIAAFHAGVECGLFVQGLPGLDAISVGPTIRDVHTPEEHMPLDSFARCYTQITAVLARLAGRE